MKAVICTKYGPPEVLEIREIAKPIPKNHQVLVKVQATTVSSSDCYVRGCAVPFPLKVIMGLVLGFKKPRQPVLGMDFAGEIEAVGKKVTNFNVGDQVFGFDRFGFGTYAQYKCIAAAGMIAPKSGPMIPADVAALPYGGLLALSYLQKAGFKAGQKILIRGASGAVGSAAVQLAKYYGLQVTGVCSTANLALVESLGADIVLDYSKDDYLRRPEKYDLILDAVPAGAGHGMGFKEQCQAKLLPKGRYISIRKGSPSLRRQNLLLLNRLYEAGRLKPVIDKIFPLEQIVQAHSYVESWHKKGNVVITIQ